MSAIGIIYLIWPSGIIQDIYSDGGSENSVEKCRIYH